MKARNVRLTSAVIAAVTVLTIAALTVPTALGAPNLHFAFLNAPADAVKNANITTSPFNTPAGDPIRVQLQDEANNPVTNQKVTATLQLAGNGPSSATINAPKVTTVNGVATFATLSVDTPNEPEFTDYRLMAVSTKGPSITGGPSGGFDIWATADGCGPDDPDTPLVDESECEVSINHYLSTFDPNSTSTYVATTGAAGSLSASTIPANLLPELSCEGHEPIFSDTIFVNESTGTGPVFVSSHITRKDMKAAANNGQKHIGWCVGLVGPEGAEAWAANGAENVVAFDMNGDTVDDFFVAMAPPCPNLSPDEFAPCITAQFGDGNGGNITEGYLPAGDPPKRG